MKIKIMYPNPHGRLEFSKEELEQILKEAYEEGVADGMNSRSLHLFLLSLHICTLRQLLLVFLEQ